MILPPFLNFLVVGLHMQAVVTIKLYGYMDTNTTILTLRVPLVEQELLIITLLEHPRFLVGFVLLDL
jgi:hypothetical protein